MRKKIALNIPAFCILVAVILALLTSQSLSGRSLQNKPSPAVQVFKVHNLDTGLNYTTIQEAINANETLDGHTIFVEKGTYYERAVINKSLLLLGENRETTIIDGNGTEFWKGSDSVIYVTADNVSISGFTVQNSGGNSYWHLVGGICLASDYNRIDGNKIRDNNYGIQIGDPYITGSTNNTVTGNIVQNNNYGVFGMSSYNATVANNTVTSNSEGIRFMGLSGNDFNIISGNLVSGNKLGIGLEVVIVIGGGASAYSVAQDSSQPPNDSSPSCNTIVGNTVINNEVGILLVSSNNTVRDNFISSNLLGIDLDYLPISCNNSIYHNNFVNNTDQVVTSNVTNVWDDGFPVGGNFWSDYGMRYPNATEIDASGIWDTPYIIDVNNMDRYPLVISEFPSFLILSLFMVSTLLGVLICRMKSAKTKREWPVQVD